MTDAVRIEFTDDAIEDLRRLGPDAVPRLLKKILILETDPEAGQPLGGDLTGYRKLVAGRNTWRVVYRLVHGAVEVCEVWAIGMRRDAAVYEEASRRVAAAVSDKPELARLTDVIERLGRLARGVESASQPAAAPVPDWLAERLTRTVGLKPEEVAAMDVEKAFDRWNSYLMAPKSAE
jgi:mRNA interferase RelE/StbE